MKALILTNHQHFFETITRKSDSEPLQFSQSNVLLSANPHMIFVYSQNYTPELIALLISGFTPSCILPLFLGTNISNEALHGDLLIPSVLFSYDSSLESLDFTDISQSPLIASSPIFLDSFGLSGNFDFESLGVTFGAIITSSPRELTLNENLIRGIFITYAADSITSQLQEVYEYCSPFSDTIPIFPAVLSLDFQLEDENFEKISFEILLGILGVLISENPADFFQQLTHDETGAPV